MKKRSLALLLAVLCAALLLTGCASKSTSTETEVDRPTVTVSLGDTVLTATPESEEEDTAAATATAEAETEAVDNNIYNAVPAGSVLTLSGAHASGIVSICYRFDGSTSPTVVKAASAEVTVPDGASKLELYVINGNGIASEWATYYLTVGSAEN